jgi:hypothetical protein
MATYSLKIPSRIGVSEPVEFVKNKLWIAPLNENTNPIESDSTIKNIEFLFNDVQSYQEIEGLVKDWFNFFGSLLSMPQCFSYLALNRHIYKECFENSSELKIKQHLEDVRNTKKETIPFYRIVNGKLKVPFNRHIEQEKLNVVELFKKFYKLNEDDELRSNFEFLSVSKNLMAHASYFHNNVFYKTAHYYILFESIINRNVNSKEKVRRNCNNCSNEIELNPSFSDKVREYFLAKKFTDDNIYFIVELIKAYGKDRSKIVHWGKKQTMIDATNNLSEKVSKSIITLDDQIKHHGVSVSSDVYFSEICQLLIIEELVLK